MLCMECVLHSYTYTIQKIGPSCTKCEKTMARFYCDICHLFDDDPQHAIFHCDQCGMCRRGLREHFTHCEICNVCRANGEHKCITDVLKTNCPYCAKNLHSSTKASEFLPYCGHGVHSHCFIEFKKKHNFTDKNTTPLIMAASQGHLDIVKSIVMEKEKEKPNSDEKTWNKRCDKWKQEIKNAFVEAVRSEREEVITYFVQNEVSLAILLPLWCNPELNKADDENENIGSGIKNSELPLTIKTQPKKKDR